MEVYNEDYFERGVAKGISLYENYRWIPELTIPLAMSYIDLLELTREDDILDFGCAKGYVVKALRMLYRKAWGCDISYYAITHADEKVKDYVEHCGNSIIPFTDMHFDWIISKDVLEHVEAPYLQNILATLKAFCKGLFVVVPLGECDKFNVPAYNLDPTHKLAKSLYWWCDQFTLSGWKLKMAEYKIEGIKDNWASFEQGNGFFVLRSEDE